MSWPDPINYSSAVQNPKVCFGDSELKTGTVRTNKLGLPIGICGNFAIVYCADCANSTTYAVRAFTRQVTDQEERYKLLSLYLIRLSLPMLVEFEYYKEGIFLKNQWYPIVKMGWVRGESIATYLKKHLQTPKELETLAAKWRGVVSSLYGANMAHGDLQHGNIMVEQSQIKLVDYDGMYINNLRKNPPGEVGHPNYQHPERISQGYYEKDADNFSAILIYLSLLALKADPSLWDQFNNGENLIFTANDLKNPGNTSVWKALKNSTDPEVQSLEGKLEHYCKGSVSGIPSLEEVLHGWENGYPDPKPEWLQVIRNGLKGLRDYSKEKRKLVTNLSLLLVSAILIIGLYTSTRNRVVDNVETSTRVTTEEKTSIDDLIKEDKYGEALERCEKLLKTCPQSDQIGLKDKKHNIKRKAVEAGDVSYKAGEYSKAINYYQVAVRIDPYNEALKKQLAECKALLN